MSDENWAAALAKLDEQRAKEAAAHAERQAERNQKNDVARAFNVVLDQFVSIIQEVISGLNRDLGAERPQKYGLKIPSERSFTSDIILPKFSQIDVVLSLNPQDSKAKKLTFMFAAGKTLVRDSHEPDEQVDDARLVDRSYLRSKLQNLLIAYVSD